jgi:hypothetical protein
MARTGVVLSVAVAVGLASSGVALANPEPEPPCSYTLSSPEIVQVGGATMVTASVSPSACGFPASPRQSVACVQRHGDAIECMQGNGDDPARVYTPYHPGATYTATGRGCAGWSGINQPPRQCQLLGPLTATF